MSDDPAAARPRAEAAELESHGLALLLAAFRALPDPVWLKDPGGVHLACNARYEQLCGVPASEIIGKTDDAFVSSERAERFRRQDAEVIAAGKPIAFENVVFYPEDGHAEVVEVLKSLLIDGEGRLVGVLGVARNISERKTAEAALELQNRVLGMIAAGAPLEGTLDAIARGIEEQAPGMRASILLLESDGVHLRHGAAPSLPASYTTALDGLVIGERAGSCGTAAYLKRSVIVEDIGTDPLWEPARELALSHGLRACWSTPILAGSGQVLGTFALYFPEPGRPTAHHQRLVDLATHAASIAISRSREVEALRKSEARYRLLADNATDVVWLYDLDADRFVYVSPSANRLGSRWDERASGFSMRDVLTDDSWRRVEALLYSRRAAFEAGDASARSAVMEVDEILSDGSVRPVEVAASLVTDPQGRVTHLQGVTRDLSDRRRSEEAKRKLQEQLQQSRRIDSVVRLAGGIAHDFNNMLAVIQGYAALALEQVETSNPAYEGLCEIRTAARRAAGSVRQLLAFAQKQPAAPRAVDLNAALEQLRPMLTSIAGSGVEVSLRPGEGMWPVRIDPVQLDQILEALLANARDAVGDRGTIVVETANRVLDAGFCAVRPGSLPGDHAMLAVHDDGCGMDRAVLDRVFEPFFTTKTAGSGPGLGLPTAYGIVKQNGGYIDIESAPGEGTHVRIFLPRLVGALADDRTGGTAGGEPDAVKAQAAGETVLLVEDEPALLRLATAMLQRLGYAVLPADGPESALRTAAEHRGAIHVLVTDVVMPGMNGRELSERLLETRPGMGRLFVSGHAEEVVTGQGMIGEGVRLLSKPFSSEELAVAVREALGAGRAHGAEVSARTEAPPWVRVLYVDDEDALVQLMKRALGRLGFAVTATSDPLAALAAFGAEPGSFDVVVSDLSMPRLPGLELARRVLAIRPDVPVVLTSGYVSSDDEAASRAAGAKALILKPGTTEELGTALDACIRSVLRGK